MNSRCRSWRMHASCKFTKRTSASEALVVIKPDSVPPSGIGLRVGSKVMTPNFKQLLCQASCWTTMQLQVSGALHAPAIVRIGRDYPPVMTPVRSGNGSAAEFVL